MTTVKPTITARGKVERMGPNQFNVLVEDVDRYLAEFEEAGCGIRADWAGKKPLLVTISRREWVSQLHPGDEVEYVLEPVEHKAPKGDIAILGGRNPKGDIAILGGRNPKGDRHPPKGDIAPPKGTLLNVIEKSGVQTCKALRTIYGSTNESLSL